jgi:hypothetical protein
LYVEDEFYTQTLQLDFKLPSFTWNSKQVDEVSQITFNGLDQTNLKIANDPDDRGFTYMSNQIEKGKWLILLEDMTLLG